MKKLIFALIIVPVMAWSLAGCSKDGNGDKFWISYGTVETVNSGGQPGMIVRDDGAELHISANMIPQAVFEAGDRLWVNYTILGDASDGYQVRLNSAYEILRKDPVVKSEITEDDHVGDDPVRVVDAWFGGVYLNVYFGLMRQDPALVHYINLVVDDEGVYDDGKVHVYLKHSAEGDAESRMSYGMVSFDITGLIPDGANSVDIMLHWTDYDGGNYNDSGVFTPYGVSGQVETVNLTESIPVE
jgi:hypothetical protein